MLNFNFYYENNEGETMQEYNVKIEENVDNAADLLTKTFNKILIENDIIYKGNKIIMEFGGSI